MKVTSYDRKSASSESYYSTSDFEPKLNTSHQILHVELLIGYSSDKPIIKQSTTKTNNNLTFLVKRY